MKSILAFMLLSSAPAFAVYTLSNGRRPPGPITATACGGYDLNGYGKHEPGQLTISIYSRSSAEPSVSMEIDNAQADAIEGLHCVCIKFRQEQYEFGGAGSGFWQPATTPLSAPYACSRNRYR